MCNFGILSTGKSVLGKGRFSNIQTPSPVNTPQRNFYLEGKRID